MSEELEHHARSTGGAASTATQRMHLPDIELPPNLTAGAIGIADMANAFGVTHRTLHFYEEKNLIAAGRAGLMRIYDTAQVRRMAIINACRETGMPVAVIQDLMEALSRAVSKDEANSIFLHALEVRRRELAAEQSTILRQMHRVSALIGQSAGLSGEANDNVSADDLTATELHCLALMSEGYAPTRLMRALKMEAPQVTELEAEIIRKLGAKNRFQAVAKAVLLGIIH